MPQSVKKVPTRTLARCKQTIRSVRAASSTAIPEAKVFVQPSKAQFPVLLAGTALGFQIDGAANFFYALLWLSSIAESNDAEIGEL